MSEDQKPEFKVPVTTIKEIHPHSNAERLEIARCFDFAVVIQKGKFKVGSEIIYIPIDSVLCEKLEKLIFPEESKIKLHNSRIKQIRLRGFPSQGLIVSIEEVKSFFKKLPKEGDNVAEILGITKYEPPTPSYQNNLKSGKKTRKVDNPYFRQYNGISNIKWFMDMFEGEEVVVQEKLHGSHIRFGKAPFVPTTLWHKIRGWFNLNPKTESLYGSNNVQITGNSGYKGYYGEDIYGKCLQKLNAFDKIKEGEFVHGEIIGPGIQKGYTYGHKEHHLVIFDVRILQADGTQKWLNPEEAEEFAKERGFTFVPVLYKGLFSKEVVENKTRGKSAYWSKEISEGCVVKSRYKYDDLQSKRALKSINPDYLDTDPTDNH